jgi:hypothetical protein
MDLVDHLPEEHPNELDNPTRHKNIGPHDYVVVATANDSIQEGQICSFLQAHGIPARSIHEGLRRRVATEPTNILVPSESANAARDLLQRVDRGEFRIDASDT